LNLSLDQLYDKEQEEIEDDKEIVIQQTAEVANAIRGGKHVVFYTGFAIENKTVSSTLIWLTHKFILRAGISTNACLPDYRGPQGVWTLRATGNKRTKKTLGIGTSYSLFRAVVLIALVKRKPVQPTRTMQSLS